MSITPWHHGRVRGVLPAVSDDVLDYGTISGVTDSTGQSCSSVDVLTIPKGHKPEYDTAAFCGAGSDTLW